MWGGNTWKNTLKRTNGRYCVVYLYRFSVTHEYMLFQSFQRVCCGKSTADFMMHSSKHFHCLECNITLTTFFFYHSACFSKSVNLSLCELKLCFVSRMCMLDYAKRIYVFGKQWANTLSD